MPNNMSPQEKMTMVLAINGLIFGSKAANTDIVTVRYQHPNIVNGKPLLSGNVRVGGEVNGRWFKDTTTGKQTLRGFYVDVQTDGKILQLMFIEQNPNKVDAAGNLKPMANAARQGHKIMWIIDRKVKNGFLGRVQNGQFIASQDRATTPVQKPVAQPSAAASLSPYDRESEGSLPWEEEALPVIPDAEIPDDLVALYAEMEPGDETIYDETTKY